MQSQTGAICLGTLRSSKLKVLGLIIVILAQSFVIAWLVFPANGTLLRNSACKDVASIPVLSNVQAAIFAMDKRNKLPPGLYEIGDNRSRSFKESAMMHKWLDGLYGIEIGASSHNGFGLNTLNVDYTSEKTVFSEEQIKVAGVFRRVDIIAPGDDLPIRDHSVDFVISSHAIEHFYDPIGTICEWLRVVCEGGYVAIIAPHKERTFDLDRPRTSLRELLERRQQPIDPAQDTHDHWTVWITQDFLNLCDYMGWKVVQYQDVDDKVGNGFSVLIEATTEARTKC